MRQSIKTELRRLGRMLHTHGLWLTLLAGIDKFYRWQTGCPLWMFSKITPGVFVGGQPGAYLFEQLISRGFSGVINLRYEFNYAMEMPAAELEYKYIPVVDNEAPRLDQLACGVEFINAHLAQKGKVYIHCWEGLGRGPTMAAAYLVACGNCTAEQAWAKIRKIRPFIRPVQKQIECIHQFALYQKTLNSPHQM